MPNNIGHLKELSMRVRIEWKNFFIVFISTYGILWSFLEPLNLFGVGNNLWVSLGGFGYVILLLLSVSLATSIEFFRILKVLLTLNNKIKALNNESQEFRLVNSFEDLINENLSIIRNAKEILIMTGSRSRDASYLQTIEQKLVSTPSLTHIRILFGSPHHQIFKNHLLNLIKIRNPYDRSSGNQTLFIGLFDDFIFETEKFICANEDTALVVLPSIYAAGNYDTALVVNDPKYVKGLIQYVREIYISSKPIDRAEEIRKLQVLRKAETPAKGA